MQSKFWNKNELSIKSINKIDRVYWLSFKCIKWKKAY